MAVAIARVGIGRGGPCIARVPGVLAMAAIPTVVGVPSALVAGPGSAVREGAVAAAHRPRGGGRLAGRLAGRDRRRHVGDGEQTRHEGAESGHREGGA